MFHEFFHKFGIWYFDFGFMLVMLFGFIAGSYAGRKNNVVMLVATVTVIAFIGALAIYGKYYCN